MQLFSQTKRDQHSPSGTFRRGHPQAKKRHIIQRKWAPKIESVLTTSDTRGRADLTSPVSAAQVVQHCLARSRLQGAVLSSQRHQFSIQQRKFYNQGVVTSQGSRTQKGVGGRPHPLWVQSPSSSRQSTCSTLHKSSCVFHKQVRLTSHGPSNFRTLAATQLVILYAKYGKLAQACLNYRRHATDTARGNGNVSNWGKREAKLTR